MFLSASVLSSFFYARLESRFLEVWSPDSLSARILSFFYLNVSISMSFFSSYLVSSSMTFFACFSWVSRCFFSSALALCTLMVSSKADILAKSWLLPIATSRTDYFGLNLLS